MKNTDEFRVYIMGVMLLAGPLTWFLLSRSYVDGDGETGRFLIVASHTAAIALLSLGLAVQPKPPYSHPWLSTALVCGYFPFLIALSVSLILSLGDYPIDAMSLGLTAVGVAVAVISLPLFFPVSVFKREGDGETNGKE